MQGNQREGREGEGRWVGGCYGTEGQGGRGVAESWDRSQRGDELPFGASEPSAS